MHPYRKAGRILKPPSTDCVRYLLACTTFGTIPVQAFIPCHPASIKGVVQDVNASLSLAEVLEPPAPAGATAVHRCSRLVDNKRINTEYDIVPFAQLPRPNEMKAWPLI